jgi:spermidine/putrescine transport system permease protein
MPAKRPVPEAERHARRALRKSERPSFSSLVLALTLAFLFLPLAVIAFFSFNDGKGAQFAGFSLRWYRALFFDSAPLWESLLNSAIVAFASASAATVLGAAAAVGAAWYRFHGKTYIRAVTFLPMALPEVIVGVSLLVFFRRLGVPLGMGTIIVAHVTFCLPFVFMMVGARLEEFDFSVVEAARDLGATERQTMLRVVVPALTPGILSGFILSATMSLEDFVITFFVAGPGSTTLPLYIYSMIRLGVSPVVNALSVVLVIGTVLAAVLLRRFLKTFASAQ